MRILYWSIPSFADSDFPLIKALREAGHEVFSSFGALFKTDDTF